MLRIDHLTYRIGGRMLFDDASATVHSGHRVGLVGRNGAGKTTLLRLLTGELEPDGGEIELPTAARIGVTSQEAPSGQQSLIETVLRADDELMQLEATAATATDAHEIAAAHERLATIDAYTANTRAARILAGLGFSEEAQQRPCEEFSGGWRMRVALAGLLFSAPDLLLLDEPTNHLDLEATLWLEEYLRAYPGTVLVISHDRDLLNRVAQHILHLEKTKLTLYAGNYDRFEATRRARLEQDEKSRTKQAAQRVHLEKFVERFRYKASKAKQAQSRLKMLERLQPIADHQEERTISFDFPEPAPLAPPLFTADDAAIGYAGTPVLRGLDFRLDQDDRIGLLGANGNGKSTLIKLLAGQLTPLGGRVAKSNKLACGYFAQHQADELDMSATPLLELQRRLPRNTEEKCRAHLGRFGFSGDRAETPTTNLSGGEKARLLFALMSCEQPQLLLLDEPTNHLDLPSRDALIQALATYQGAVIIVSHDPHLLQLTADRLWLVADGTVTPYEGDLDDYRKLLLDGPKNGKNGSKADHDEAEQPRKSANKKAQRQQAATQRAELAELRKKLRTAEQAVEKLESEKARIEAEMADPTLYADDSSKLIALQRKFGEVSKTLSATEVEWLALQEALEGPEA